MSLRLAMGRLRPTALTAISRTAATKPAINFQQSRLLTRSRPLLGRNAPPGGAKNSPKVSRAASNSNAPKSTPNADAKTNAANTTKAADAASGKEEAEVEEVPLSSLPDLTQGIPSTLEQEMAGAAGSAAALAAIEKPAYSSGGRKKGELPASAYVSSSEKRRQRMANYAFGSFIGLSLLCLAYAGRDWDEDEAKRHADIPNGWGLGLWWTRASTRTKDMLSYYHEPAFEKLLPDAETDPNLARPYTLCISLEDMLVHSEWTREHGWRMAKRPGADYFLHYLSQYYELVLFTSVPSVYAEPIVRKLDPYHFIIYPLFREATKYKDGEVIKDLSYLNRDLSKVIILDTSAEHVRAQPENAIVLPKWKGDAKDTGLVDLVPFLEYVNVMQFEDVRKVLKSFEGTNIPVEFARREAIARAKFHQQLEGQKKRRSHTGEGGIGSLMSLFGLKSSNMGLSAPADGEANMAEEFAQGKMIQDIARERGQRVYEMMEKEIKANGEKWLKEEAEMQEKLQQEAMQSMKQSFTGWFVGGGPNGAENKGQSDTKA